uniref:Uncharacterized protein n=1 Tax=Rhizophora mucronata TaxID=61149 RepID=A0A2P2QXA9_RHIMU
MDQCADFTLKLFGMQVQPITVLWTRQLLPC